MDLDHRVGLILLLQDAVQIIADRLIDVVVPKWWNSFSNYLKNIQCEANLRSKLKTHLIHKLFEQ